VAFLRGRRRPVEDMAINAGHTHPGCGLWVACKAAGYFRPKMGGKNHLVSLTLLSFCL